MSEPNPDLVKVGNYQMQKIILLKVLKSRYTWQGNYQWDQSYCVYWHETSFQTIYQGLISPKCGSVINSIHFLYMNLTSHSWGLDRPTARKVFFIKSWLKFNWDLLSIPIFLMFRFLMNLMVAPQVLQTVLFNLSNGLGNYALFNLKY